MALVDITPVMTSDNTPAPYVVTQTNYYSGIHLGFLAFDNNPSTFYWSANISNVVTIDMGGKKNVSAFGITPIDAVNNFTPKDFKLQGSNDNSIFTDLITVTNETNWGTEEKRYEATESLDSYRYYRVAISTTNGQSTYKISEIKLYEDETPPPTPSVQSLRYTLPFGSKTRLDSLSSNLTYMLATEDDGNNEGTLRIVDKNGKFSMAKAGIKYDLIWSGKAITPKTNYILENNLKNYKAIVIVASLYNVTTNRNSMSQMRIVPEILGGVSNDILFTISTTTYVGMNFDSDGNSFNVFDSSLASGCTGGITSIYGIY